MKYQEVNQEPRVRSETTLLDLIDKAFLDAFSGAFGWSYKYQEPPESEHEEAEWLERYRGTRH
jgi:hypothetical protein